MLEPTQRKFTPEEHAHLTAIQRRQEGKELDARVAASEIALRQWCVEQAAKVCPQQSPYLNWIGDSEQTGPQTAIARISQEILDFVTAPLKPEQS